MINDKITFLYKIVYIKVRNKLCYNNARGSALRLIPPIVVIVLLTLVAVLVWIVLFDILALHVES